MDDIPPLLPAEQMSPIRNGLDLHERWRALLGELRFEDRKLWITFLEPGGMMVPHVVQVAEPPTHPTGDNLDALLEMCEREMEWFGPGGSVAILLSRPGHDAVTESDRAWAIRTATAARDHGIHAHPMHIATHAAVRVLAPDDLIGAA